MLNYLSTMLLRHLGEWTYSSTILDHNTRWSCQLHALTALPQGKEQSVPTDRRQGGHKRLLSGRCGKEKNLAPARIQNPTSTP
jgi:hypothetical protein